MKVRLTVKDPDGVQDAIVSAARASAAAVAGLTDDEREMVIDNRTEEITKALKRWIRHDEYLTVEFDLAAGTAQVVPTNA